MRDTAAFMGYMIENWFATHEWLAIWLEGIALVAIFIWDRIDSNQQHKQETAQLRAFKDQADAALIAANAAKKSADLTAEIQRPHLGIADVSLSGSTRYFNTTLSVRNFGGLAAINVRVKLEFLVDDSLRRSYTEPSLLQVFPSEPHPITGQFDSGETDAAPIRAGQKQLSAKVSILYELHDGREFEYAAELRFEHTSSKLILLRSGTSQKIEAPGGT